MPYRYDDMGDERFQHMCQALLAHVMPDVQCFPVSQPDGGRDAVNRAGLKLKDRVVFQVKWTGQPSAVRDPVKWLTSAINGEREKIKRLVSEGLRQYILMTNIRATAAPHRGTHDRLEVELDKLSKELKVPITCWWKDEIDRRMDLGPGRTEVLISGSFGWRRCSPCADREQPS
jgi:hypothetical protein